MFFRFLDQALSDGNDLSNGGSIGEFAAAGPALLLRDPPNYS
jgi:hypothetical protein